MAEQGLAEQGGRPSYEQARQRLIAVVQELESGSVPLSRAMELWQEGEQLARTCQEWLDGAKATIQAARAPQSEEHDANRA